MAAKPRNIFTRSKPLLNIYSGVDHEGKQVEVREDAEQLVKWHEIADALVAAGYYRAQLQGLSEFDKIVGGLTWCIELCDIDVDVSLLFEENLTIGKKIALTEKIVTVLPTMKCPHTIEPHQIQGLDFINIFPLVQWLIKHSSEFREAKEDELRRFAVMQYEKRHIFESDRARFTQREKMLRNLAAVQNLYKPCRVRKRKGGLPANELDQVNATLSEYDQRMLMHVTANRGESRHDDGLDFLYDYEKTLADPSQITTETARHKQQFSNGTDSSDTKIHYALLQSEVTGEVSQELEQSEKIKYSEEVERLAKTIEDMERNADEIRNTHKSNMETSKKQYTEVLAELQNINEKLMKSDVGSGKDVKELYKSLKDLARERNELLQIIEKRQNQYNTFANEVSALRDPNTSMPDDPLTPEETAEFEARRAKLLSLISSLKLEVGKLSRSVLRYSVALDEVPGPAELLQYERRFIELYNQVASKHKETKQYYIFYNTLFEVKLYTSKELSLLNSILDNYEEAMSSTRKREEFMSQFESIVDWVNQTVKKVEQKYKVEKDKKTDLHDEFSRLLDVQRQYATAVKKLAEELIKHGQKETKLVKRWAERDKVDQTVGR